MQIETMLKQAKEASYQLAVLTTDQKNTVLKAFAKLIEDNADMLLTANEKDLAREKGQLSESMYQRLKLDKSKLKQLAQGICDVVELDDPVGKVLMKTKLDNDLILEKISVPLGVVGIIFESRPDVIPQILSLTLKSANAVVLKGGREAFESNQAFMTLVEKLNAACSFLPEGWAQLLESREAVHELLNYPQYVDLVIPRGSNEQVQSIMESTKIPVLGHADGVCHMYIHSSANLDKAVEIAIDAKAQYPAACNALETLLVDKAVAEKFLPAFEKAAQVAGITLKGSTTARKILPEMESVTDWHVEYGDKTLSINVVENLDEAILHINTYGSHHTESILAEDPKVIETFLNRVASACVFANASTRFADGFRFGFGAEIGISTAKTHARGPVGLEGLVIYKYVLRGKNHVVKDYVGENAKSFLHEKLT